MKCMKNQQIDDITQNYSISRVFASFPTQTFSIYRRLPFAAPIFPISFQSTFLFRYRIHNKPRNMSDSPAATPLPKDPEGITEQIQSVSTPPPPPQAQKPARQKKIAVLTSGGDSAGMNAAGE